MNGLRLGAITLLVAPLLGCASSGYGGPISGGSDNLSPSERRLQAVEGRTAELSRRLDAVNLTGMDQDAQRIRDDQRQLRGEVERLRFEFDQAQKRNRDLYLDLDRRLQRFENLGGGASAPPAGVYGGTSGLTPSASATVTPSGTVMTAPPMQAPTQMPAPGGAVAPVTISNGAGGSPEEESAYLTAFDSLKNGKYDDAIRGFKSLVAQWPAGRYADNALYWTGEAYYVKRDYKSALASFQEVLQRFPASPKGPDALLKVGLTQIELKQEAEGKATLQRLVQTYPQSSAARLAEQRLGGN
ncbi:tol-pal system protein YbgF [Sinimarinibacterium sp. CAU 1509]|uniref:tol-pal system protein YbgF n=1 Tax=Sinimarinibacterium sp. CAU 1509 TaxID=2562283 RepID=UPI0010AD8D3D|nr:tol-pal system protein YbgF [Sinimarinibacterium sp. CAU 1509]TJY60829.1 tol-pal system protein YbgF [Sinimarinibacterium sp. CAU 1509]